MRHFINRLKWSLTFPRMIDIATVLFCIFVLSALFLHCCQRQQLKAEISSLSDENYLINALSLRHADDCTITSIEGGWKCVELKENGKTFIVRRPW